MHEKCSSQGINQSDFIVIEKFTPHQSKAFMNEFFRLNSTQKQKV